MVCVLNSRSRSPGSSTGQGHPVVFLGKTLYFHSASLHPGIQMGTSKFNAGSDFATPCPPGTSRKVGWGCVAHFPKPLPYLWPKSAFFATLFMTIATDTVALNISYEELLLTALLITMKK